MINIGTVLSSASTVLRFLKKHSWYGLMLLVLLSVPFVAEELPVPGFFLLSFTMALSVIVVRDWINDRTMRLRALVRAKQLDAPNEWKLKQFRRRGRLLLTGPVLLAPLAFAIAVLLSYGLIDEHSAPIIVAVLMFATGLEYRIFLRMRATVQPPMMIPYRETTSGQGLVRFIKKLAYVKSKHDTPGDPAALSALLPLIFVALLLLGLLVSSHYPAAPVGNTNIATPTVSTTAPPMTTPSTWPPVTTPPTPTTQPPRPQPQSTSTTAPLTATTSKTTPPVSIVPAAGCDIGADLGDAVSKDQLAAINALYTSSDGCVLMSNGKPLITTYGHLIGIAFSTDSATASTYIVVDESNTPRAIAAADPILSTLRDDPTVVSVSEPILIGVSKMRLAVVESGRCHASVTADSETPPVLVGPTTAPAVLNVFIALGQVGKPSGSDWQFDPPNVLVTVTPTAITGVDPAVARLALAATSCPSIDTITGAKLRQAP